MADMELDVEIVSELRYVNLLIYNQVKGVKLMLTKRSIFV